MTHSVRTARRALSISAAAIAIAVTAACSSSSSTAGSSSGGSQSTGSNGGGSQEVTAAKAVVDAAIKVPTTIPLTTPLTSKPPTGKTFIFMKCDTATCQVLSDGMQQASQALGWSYKTISYKSADPATLLASLRLALNYKPVAVAMSGIPPEAGWSPAIAQYKSAGIPIIASYLAGLTYDDTLIADIAGPKAYTGFGQALANWFIADSDGKGIVINQRVNDFPILKTVSDAFAAEVASKCSGCKIIDLKNTIADATGGKITPTVISELRKNPSATYVMSSDSEFLDGLDSALGAAGLSGKVELIGQGSTVGQLSALKNGTGAGAAYTGLALHYSGWAIVDVALRHLEGMTFDPEGGGLPSQLFVKGGDFAATASFDEPADYQAQFKTLWKLG